MQLPQAPYSHSHSYLCQKLRSSSIFSSDHRPAYRAHRLIQIGIAAAFSLCGVVGLINAVVDPYGMFRWIDRPGFNAYKPAHENHVRLFKAFDVSRIRPRAIVIGTSRSDIALRMSHPGWTIEPRYNLALDGGTAEEMYAYLQHAEAVGPLQQVVMGLDTWQLEGTGSGVTPDFDPSVLSTPTTQLPRLQRDLASLRLVLSLDTFSASLRTLAVRDKTDPGWFAADGHRIGAIFFRGAEHDFHRFGPRQHFLQVDEKEIEYKFPFPVTSAPARSVRSAPSDPLENIMRMIRFCREHGIDLRIYITPAHAHQMEIAAAAGAWDRIEANKRKLVRFLAEDAADYGTPLVPLWDFSGYSSVTEESLPAAGDKREMRFYWESSHFKEEVGDWILDRVLGTQRSGHEIPDDFGKLLTLQSVDRILTDMRRAHETYTQTHPEDEAWILRHVAERRAEIAKVAERR